MYDDEYPPEPERCAHRCEAHPYIPCCAGIGTHTLHRCVLCNPKRKPPRFRKGDRVTHTTKAGDSLKLVVSSVELASLWGYLCFREGDTKRQPIPYLERELKAEG